MLRKKKILVNDVDKLARLGVPLMNSINVGVVVMSWVESSLVSEAKEKHDQVLFFLNYSQIFISQNYSLLNKREIVD